MKTSIYFTKLSVFILFLFIISNSCKKDDNNENSPTPTEPDTLTLNLQPDAAAGKDAMIWEAGTYGPNNITNYGGNKLLLVQAWTNASENDTIRVLIDFDLSTIPISASIIYARLFLFHNPDNTYGHSGNSPFFIRRITSNWEENVVTWMTQPTTTTDHQASIPKPANSDEDFLGINVTDMVKDMISDPQNSYGFMVRLQIEEPYKRLDLASSDHSNNSAHPKLEVRYVTQ